MFPVFQKLRDFLYVEYFLVGCGAAFPVSSQKQIPKWLGPGSLVVEPAARIVSCEKEGSAAIEQEWRDTGHVDMCETCRDIQNQFVISAPRSSRRARRAQEDGDLLGGGNDLNNLLGRVQASAAESGDEASSVSSDEDQPSGSEAETEAEHEEKMATDKLSGSTAYAKIRQTRQGMPAQLWTQVFHAVQPSKVVVAGTVSCQAGLMLAILRYNESVWGLSQCSLVGFCPKEPPKSTEPQVWTSKHVKQWQARHLCLHTIERTFAAHAGHLYAAVAAPGGTAAGGTAAGAGANSRVKAEVPNEASLGGGLPATTPTVTKFILPYGFHGKDSKLLPKPPPGEPAPDSDDPDGDAPSRDHTTKAMNKRNTRFMNRHSVRVAMSGEASGMGLFASSDIPAETELPAKGPWFHSLDAVNTFLAGLHNEKAAKMWSTRVVRVDLAPEGANGPAATAASQGPQSMFKIITNPVGFVNNFLGLAAMPNCRLVMKEGQPFGEHCLVLQSTKLIRDGKEWLMNYGPLHKCGNRQTRRRMTALNTRPVARGGDSKLSPDGTEEAEDATPAASQGGA